MTASWHHPGRKDPVNKLRLPLTPPGARSRTAVGQSCATA
jgi:hypothetical protein